MLTRSGHVWYPETCFGLHDQSSQWVFSIVLFPTLSIQLHFCIPVSLFIASVHFYTFKFQTCNISYQNHHSPCKDNPSILTLLILYTWKYSQLWTEIGWDCLWDSFHLNLSGNFYLTLLSYNVALTVLRRNMSFLIDTAASSFRALSSTDK